MTEPAASGTSPSAEFGQVFRAARDDAGMTQDEVADVLHLDVAVVAAIEEGRFAALPMRPYARGYVRNYARVLGLEPDELARRFDAADEGRPEPSVVVPRHRLTPKAELALRPLALGYAAIVAVLLIALGAVLWTAWRVQDWQFPFLADDPDIVSTEPETTPQPVAVPPASPPSVSPWPSAVEDASELADAASTEDLVPAPSPEDPVLAPSPEDTVPTPSAGEPVAETGIAGTLTVVFDDESWVSVDDATGRQLFGDLGRGGRTITVAGPLPLSVLVGNALAVRVEFDGEPVDLGPFTSENNVARLELGGD